MTHLGTFRGFNYRNPEPVVTLGQAWASGVALVVLAVAVVMRCV